MITEIEVEEKLRNLAVSFMNHFWNHKYYEAKYCYDTAVRIVKFLDITEEMKKELFGNRPYVDDEKDIKEGLFREELVQKAYWECIRKEKDRVLDEEARYLARERIKK